MSMVLAPDMKVRRNMTFSRPLYRCQYPISTSIAHTESSTYIQRSAIVPKMTLDTAFTPDPTATIKAP